MYVFALVHALHSGIVHIHDRTVQRRQFGRNQRRTHHRLMMAVENGLGTEISHHLHSGSDDQGIPVAISADSDQVGEVAEGTAEQVTRQANLVLWQPDDQRIIGFRPGYSDQYNIQPAQ